MQSGRKDTLKERYAITFCFKLGKNATETYGMLQTAFGASCMNRASVFEWHKRFKEGRESVRDDERCERSKEVNTPELIGQKVRVRVTMLKFLGSSGRNYLGRGQQSGQWHFQQDNAPVDSSILVTDYLTKWASRHFLTLSIVQTLLPVTFAYSLNSGKNLEAVLMRQLRR